MLKTKWFMMQFVMLMVNVMLITLTGIRGDALMTLLVWGFTGMSWAVNLASQAKMFELHKKIKRVRKI